jgi:hypothetical protein
MKRLREASLIAVALICGAYSMNLVPAAAQAPPAAATPEALPGSFLLTVFLRHDQTKTVDQINDHLRQTGWYDKFPPDGVEIVAWYVMMGIGQVVILRVRAEKLRETNRVIEQTAWGRLPHRVLPDLRFQAGLGIAAAPLALDFRRQYPLDRPVLVNDVEHRAFQRDRRDPSDVRHRRVSPSIELTGAARLSGSVTLIPLITGAIPVQS